ncbi:hypothetical protein SUDANB140_06025 [Streptomyces sp. enrichment culture]
MPLRPRLRRTRSVRKRPQRRHHVPYGLAVMQVGKVMTASFRNPFSPDTRC